MTIHDPNAPQRGRVLALGFFDGVHRGHQAILQTAAAVAAQRGLQPAALTFETHPRAFVRGRAPELIVSFPERCRLLQENGAELVIALPFDQRMAETSPADFAAMLVERYGARAVVCGENFRFGSHAAGTPETLRALGLETHVVPPVKLRGAVVSSTRIRECVREGKVGLARELLGRPFSLEGPIVGGFQVGRSLGFPTINTQTEPGALLPRKGVYVTAVALEGHVFRGVTNVGTRPTFSDAGILSVESHLLNFSGDVYGEQARVSFLKYLRPEQSFSSGEALREQIARDVSQALHWKDGGTIFRP